MMIFFLTLGLLLGGAAVLFALQNTEVVTVTFLHSHITGSLALILFVAISTGILVALLIVLPKTISKHLICGKLGREVERLEEELRKQKTLTAFAKVTPPTPESIEAIEQGSTVTKETYQEHELLRNRV